MRREERKYIDDLKRKEKHKIVVGLISVILIFIFLIIIVSFKNNNFVSKPIISSVSKQKNHYFIKSKDTSWQYYDKEGIPPIDSENHSWNENGYQLEDWKSASGSFGCADEGKNKADHILCNATSEEKLFPVYYFTTEFEINGSENLSQLIGEIEYDDSVIIYLNGNEIFSANVPEEGFDEKGYGAERVVEDKKNAYFTVNNRNLFYEGRNYLAVELHQSSSKSTDIFFNMPYLKGIFNLSKEEQIDISELILQPGKDEHSRVVNWMTDSNGRYEVQYCKEENQFDFYESVDMVKNEIENQYCYKADISGLERGNKYLYRIYEREKDIYSKVYMIDIPASRKGVNFLFVGDPQIGQSDELETDKEKWSRILEVAVKTMPESTFIISAGDQIDSSKTKKALDEYKVFRVPEELKQIPIAVTKGNHDTVGDLFTKQFINTGYLEDDYSFMYNEVLFVNLDSNDTDYEKHIEFLENTIQECKPKWTIVTMHYSIFSVSGHAEEEKILEARQAYAEAFSNCGVDVVLSGHDHMYTRSYFMDGLESTGKESGKKEDGEILYVVGTSSTGNKFYDKNIKEKDYVAFYDNEYNKVPLYTYISIQNNSLTMKTVRANDLKLYDECYIIK